MIDPLPEPETRGWYVSILPFSFKPPAPPTPPTPPSAPAPPPPPAPPAASSCTTTMQLAQPGAAPQQSASQMLRSSAGQTRVDTGNTSVITDPKAAQTIILNHVTKEASVLPIPAAPGLPGAPSFSPPGMPAPPTSPSQVLDLGKSVINGHAVTGKQFTFPTPTPPTPPGAPALPGAPSAPGAPALPGMPAAPPHTVMEVWMQRVLATPGAHPRSRDRLASRSANASSRALSRTAPFDVSGSFLGYETGPPPVPAPPALPK